MTLVERERPTRKRPPLRMLLIVVAVTAAVLAGGVLVVFGVSQLRGIGQRQTAEELAKQREADLQSTLQLQAQEASQSQAAQETSKQAAIPEGRLVSAHIAAMKVMRSELGSVMDALKAKAKSSAEAEDTWDRRWADRQAAYSSRYSAVSTHNARERRRRQASKTEVSQNGQLVVKYTYHPRYQSFPSRPSKPGPLSVSVDSEKKRLSALKSQTDALMSSLGSEAASAKSFASVYPTLQSTAKALGATVNDASRMADAVVVTKGAKGEVIDASKISGVNIAALDAPFAQLDASFSAALTALGLTPEQVTVVSTSTP